MPKTDSPLVQVGSRIPEAHYWYLKKLVRNQAVLQDRDFSLADLIRETLWENYPIPEGERIMAEPDSD